MEFQDFAKLFLSEALVDNFDVVRGSVDAQLERIDLWLDEKKIVPTEYVATHEVVAYGFTPESVIQDFPAIKEAYDVSMSLTQIFNTRCTKGVAITKLAAWYNDVEKLNCKLFNSVINTMQNNYATIANYFQNRATNASAESFNAKVKAFRAQLRGIEDIPLFIFRLAKLFA